MLKTRTLATILVWVVCSGSGCQRKERSPRGSEASSTPARPAARSPDAATSKPRTPALLKVVRCPVDPRPKTKDSGRGELREPMAGLRWRRRLGSTAPSQFAMDDQAVYLTMGNPKTSLVALGMSDGKVRWQVNHVGSEYDEIHLAGPLVIAHWKSAQMTGYDRRTGAKRWSLRLPGKTYHSQILRSGDLLITATDSGMLFAVSLTTGKIAWRKKLGGQHEVKPTRISDGLTLVVLKHQRLVAFETRTGKQRWSVAWGGRGKRLTRGPGPVFVYHKGGRLDRLDPQTGQVSSKTVTLQKPGFPRAVFGTSHGWLTHGGAQGGDSITLYDNASGKRRWRRRVGNNVRQVLLSALGVLVRFPKSVLVLDLRTGQVLMQLQAPGTVDFARHSRSKLLIAYQQKIRTPLSVRTFVTSRTLKKPDPNKVLVPDARALMPRANLARTGYYGRFSLGFSRCRIEWMRGILAQQTPVQIHRSPVVLTTAGIKTAQGAVVANGGGQQVKAAPPSLAVSGGSKTIFSARTSGKVVAIRLGDKPIWIHQAGPLSVGVTPVGQQVLVLTTKGEMSSLSATNGSVGWKRSFAGAGATLPTIHGKTLYLLAGKRLHVASALDGRPRRSHTLTPPAGAGPLVAAHGRLYYRAVSGAVVALRPHDGKRLWQSPAYPAPAGIAPILATPCALVVAGKKGLMALDPTTGKERWRSLAKLPIHTPPIGSGERVYVMAGDTYRLHGLHIQSGRPLWRSKIDRRISVNVDLPRASGFGPLAIHHKAILFAGHNTYGICR